MLIFFKLVIIEINSQTIVIPRYTVFSSTIFINLLSANIRRTSHQSSVCTCLNRPRKTTPGTSELSVIGVVLEIRSHFIN